MARELDTLILPRPPLVPGPDVATNSAIIGSTERSGAVILTMSRHMLAWHLGSRATND